MIAKISHGTRIYGALVYNHEKVKQGNGQILYLNNMIETPDGSYTTGHLYSSFIPYLSANKNTEKTAIHLSLNPEPKDNVSDEDFIKMAHEYMVNMGYGDQPYIVFKHTDVDRTHIHIVSTCVDQYGNKIPDSFEKRRSMDICRELERKYNLNPANEKKSTDENFSFAPVDHSKGNIKSQIASVVRYLPNYYNFQGLGSYNALLSLFNITVEHVKKEYKGEIKEGLVYCALDNSGNKVGNPFKSSLFGKHASLAALQAHFEKNNNVPPEIKAKTSHIITQALKLTSSEKEFTSFLVSCGINTVIRRNDQGRLYGITFIDHNSRQVFNGSQLGKGFSANVFHDLFFDKNVNENSKIETISPKKSTLIQQTLPRADLHPLFDFMINTGNLFTDWDLLDSLLLNSNAEDPEEQLFEFNMKKKKRKRKRN